MINAEQNELVDQLIENGCPLERENIDQLVFRLSRIAIRLRRIDIASCNRPLSQREDEEQDMMIDAGTGLIRHFSIPKLGIEYHGDPRGSSPFHLILPNGRHNSLSGGWVVPATYGVRGEK